MAPFLGELVERQLLGTDRLPSYITYTSDIASPADRGGSLVVTAIVLPAMALLFVMMKLYTRFFLIRSPGLDDGFLIVSWVLAVAFSVIVIVDTQHGLGRHVFRMILDQNGEGFLDGFLLYLWLCSMLYGVCIWTVKMSLLSLYLRLFQADRPMRLATWALIIFVTLAHAASFLTVIFGCTPVNKFWDIENSGGSCVDLLLMGAIESGLNVLTDILILFLPVKAVLGLHLPLKQRLAVAGTFLIGGVATAAAFVRMIRLIKTLDDADVTWYSYEIELWCMVELNVCIAISCVPALKPFAMNVARSVSELTKISGLSKSSEIELPSNSTEMSFRRKQRGPSIWPPEWSVLQTRDEAGDEFGPGPGQGKRKRFLELGSITGSGKLATIDWERFGRPFRTGNRTGNRSQLNTLATIDEATLAQKRRGDAAMMTESEKNKMAPFADERDDPHSIMRTVDIQIDDDIVPSPPPTMLREKKSTFFLLDDDDDADDRGGRHRR
ncbi:MAG: hypothetical protein M1838_005552 [Thelocarpon superellum]|nr:MAG: hypothetical protein M1838_005552 [Thelocarpon superellum]